MGNIRPFLLSSMIKEDNILFTVDLTNPDVYVDGTIALRRGDVHLYRSKFIWQAVCYERLELVNYSLSPIEISFAIRFDADFKLDLSSPRWSECRSPFSYSPVRR